MLELSEEDWKKKLSDEEFQILRQKGTERPFTGKYNAHDEEGSYTCSGCGEKLFYSGAKFDAGCGWPSFDASASNSAVKESFDKSYGVLRTEVTCTNCGGHLGHVFNDGPTETGQRYCINSVSLKFDKKD